MHFISDSLHSCTCLECGFGKVDDTCPCTKTHRPPCKACAESFNIFRSMLDFHSRTYIRLEQNGQFNENVALRDDLDALRVDIVNCLRNMLDYRAHIAQAEDEGAFDALYYIDLDEDVALCIIDYKMKILAAFFREKQSDWFSKRGFSLLGALIIIGSKKEDERNKVLYHSFISDDTTQNAQSVNCAKQ